MNPPDEHPSGDPAPEPVSAPPTQAPPERSGFTAALEDPNRGPMFVALAALVLAIVAILFSMSARGDTGHHDHHRHGYWHWHDGSHHGDGHRERGHGPRWERPVPQPAPGWAAPGAEEGVSPPPQGPAPSTP